MARDLEKAVVLTPTAASIEAMNEARQGNLQTVTLDELLAVLDVDDEPIGSIQIHEISS